MILEEHQIDYYLTRVEDWNKLPEKPVVTVQMATYNHDKYIRQALDGVLMQKVNFTYEILIKEDKSMDTTREIVLEYQKKHPEKFRVWLAKENLYQQGIKIALMRYAKGKYIAKLEGDDYWTDPLKLQKQVDFLEENEEYSLCYHRVSIEIDGAVESDENDITEKRYRQITDKSKIGIDDLLEHGNFIHTVSVLFRKSDLSEIAFETKYSTVGDYFLYIMLTANNTKLIKKLDDKMAVYRRGIGIYSSLHSLSMSYSILQYRICILSYLNNDSHKELLLKQTISQLKSIKGREKNKKYISDFTFKELLTQLFKKIKRRVL